MNNSYSDILKHSVVYGVGQVLSRMASVLLLPLYTSYLRPADYGCIAILDLFVGIMAIVVAAGMVPAINRYHFEATDERQRDRVWWTGLSFVTLMAVVIVFPAWMLRGAVSRLTLGIEQTDGAYFFALVIPTLLFSVIGQIPDQYFRARKWSYLSVAVSLSTLTLNICLNVYFLVVLQLGIAGILWGNLIATTAATTFRLIVFACDRGSFCFHRELLIKLLKFGAPMIIGALLSMLMHQADRYLLKMFVSMDQVGIYSLAYAIGHGTNTLILLPFAAIWNVVVYEIADRSDAKQVYAVILKYFVFGLGLILLGVSLFARQIISILAAPDYAAAADLVPIICLGYLLFSLHSHFCVPALLEKKTFSMLPVYVAGVGANLAANVLLIPVLGPLGAALATVTGFGTYSLFGLRIYSSIAKYPYPLVRCMLAIVGMAVTYVACDTLTRNLSTLIPIVLLNLGAWSSWAILLFHRQLPHLLRFAFPKSERSSQAKSNYPKTALSKGTPS